MMCFDDQSRSNIGSFTEMISSRDPKCTEGISNVYLLLRIIGVEITNEQPSCHVDGYFCCSRIYITF